MPEFNNDDLMLQTQDMIRRLQALLNDSEEAMHCRIMDPRSDGTESSCLKIEPIQPSKDSTG